MTATTIDRKLIADLAAREEKKLEDQSPKSYEMFQRAIKHMPMGVASTYHARDPYPVYYTHGKGPHVWTVDGQEIADFHNGYGCMVQGHADGVHRGLGARVHEAPTREPEGSGEVVRHDDGVLGGEAELGAQRRTLLDGLDDQRVGVALDHAAVAVVEVGDLLAVDRPDVRAFAVRVVDGVRVARMVRGSDAHRHVLDGALEHLVGLRRLIFELLLFAGGEVGDELPVDRGGCHADFSPSALSTRKWWRLVGPVYHLTVGVSSPRDAGARCSPRTVLLLAGTTDRLREAQRLARESLQRRRADV